MEVSLFWEKAFWISATVASSMEKSEELAQPVKIKKAKRKKTMFILLMGAAVGDFGRRSGRTLFGYCK